MALPKYKCFSPHQPFPRSGENYVSHPKGQADCESLMFTSFLNTALGSPFLSKYDVEAIRIAYKLK